MIRRYGAEFVGTFGIVFGPVAARPSSGPASLLEAALISGFAVLAMVSALGPISAAHFNPAVTLGFAIAKRFPWRHVVGYWLCQFLGAIAAAGLANAMFGAPNGVHVPAETSAVFRNVGMEALVTFLLMLVIMAVATDRRTSGATAPLAIGFTVAAGVLIAGRVTGGSMNPARSLGPAVFAPEALSWSWIYAVGPCLGAVVAAVAYERLRLEPEFAKDAPGW